MTGVSGLPPIRMLILSLTGLCNFACVYCYADRQPCGIMSLDTAKRALDLASAGGQAFALQFSGGEPLLAFDRLREIVLYVRQHRLPATVQVQTNASLLDREKAAFFRDYRIGVGASLDGRPSQNDTLRRLPDGGGTSRLIMNGVAALAAEGVEVGITCVVTGDNVRKLAGIVETAYYLGNVRKIGFDLLRAQGRGRNVRPAGAIEVATALQQVLSTADRLARQTGRKLIFSHRERTAALCGRCPGGFAHCHAMNGEALFVNSAGELYACASLAGLPYFGLGHVQTGVEAARLRRIEERICAEMSFCRECQWFSACGGGCFARWYGGGGTGPHLAECALKQAFIQDFLRSRAAAAQDDRIKRGAVT